MRWTGVSLPVGVPVGTAALAIPLVLYGLLSAHWLVADLGTLLGKTAAILLPAAGLLVAAIPYPAGKR